jgi:hypothetical protein
MISGSVPRPATKVTSTGSVRLGSGAHFVRWSIGLFVAALATAAAAHEIIDVDRANELVASVDVAAGGVAKASGQDAQGETLFFLGTILIDATDLLNRDLAAHSGQLTINGELLLKALSKRNLAPQFAEALHRYLIPRHPLQEAIRLAPSAAYVPRARFGLLKASFSESFAFDPFKPQRVDISALESESSEAERLTGLLNDPEEKEEAAFIQAIDLARAVKLAAPGETQPTIEARARAALKAFAEAYPDSMRAASATVILQGLERTQR